MYIYGKKEYIKLLLLVALQMFGFDANINKFKYNKLNHQYIRFDS